MICQKKKILVVFHHFDVFNHLPYVCLLRLFADGVVLYGIFTIGNLLWNLLTLILL